MQESRGDSSEEGGGARERGDQESLSFLRRGRCGRSYSRFVYSRKPIQISRISATPRPFKPIKQRKSKSEINVKLMRSRCREVNTDEGKVRVRRGVSLCIAEPRKTSSSTKAGGLASSRLLRGRRDSVSRMARSHDRRAVCRMCVCVCVHACTGARGMRRKDGG